MNDALTRVAVLVVTHNSSGTLQRTLEPLLGSGLEIILVDNGSTDETVEIAASCEGVDMLRSADNLGFGRGSNLAASQTNRDLLLLLNPDCVASTEAVATLAARLLDEPHLGFVGPQIRKESGEPDYASLRGDPDPVGALLYLTRITRLFPKSKRINRYNLTHLDYDQEQELLNGTGGCLMVRASAFQDVGGFDAEFFMYGEDLDLCRRLRQAGHPGRYLPSARVLHMKGESTRQRSGEMLVEFHRAMWVYYRKHEAASRSAAVNLAVRVGITILGIFRLAANALRREKRVSAR